MQGATENYATLVGKEAFGSVYKGSLQHVHVVVKVLLDRVSTWHIHSVHCLSAASSSTSSVQVWHMTCSTRRCS